MNILSIYYFIALTGVVHRNVTSIDIVQCVPDISIL